MIYRVNWLGRGITVAGILGALVAGSPMANAASLQIAQTGPAPSGTAGASHRHSLTGLVETMITDLHTKLKITAAEEPQFGAVSDVMRSNAQAMEALLQERKKDTDKTAVGSLHWYERLADAHADALKKFNPPFEALYTALSDSQRKTADGLFEHFGERPFPPRTKSK